MHPRPQRRVVQGPASGRVRAHVRVHARGGRRRPHHRFAALLSDAPHGNRRPRARHGPRRSPTRVAPGAGASYIRHLSARGARSPGELGVALRGSGLRAVRGVATLQRSARGPRPADAHRRGRRTRREPRELSAPARRLKESLNVKARSSRFCPTCWAQSRSSSPPSSSPRLAGRTDDHRSGHRPVHPAPNVAACIPGRSNPAGVSTARSRIEEVRRRIAGLEGVVAVRPSTYGASPQAWTPPPPTSW